MLWRDHLKRKIGKLGGDWWFVTVTSHEGNREKHATLANLRKGLDLLFKRMRRIWKGIEYVRVYELHQTGAYHAHCIISGLSSRVSYRRSRNKLRVFCACDRKDEQTWSLKTWFKKTARACKMGYKVDVRRIEGIPKVVNYVCKYITKDTQTWHVKGVRRIQCSQGIGSANERKETRGWIAAKYLFAHEVGQSKVRDLNLKLTINPSYFREHIVYPMKPR